MAHLYKLLFRKGKHPFTYMCVCVWTFRIFIKTRVFFEYGILLSIRGKQTQSHFINQYVPVLKSTGRQRRPSDPRLLSTIMEMASELVINLNSP